ncbi:MAG: hypothetical protein ACTSYR_02435 [Candidatus Odinarchaeia archaeon]
MKKASPNDHYINKIVLNEIDETVQKNLRKYSKGFFPGPVIEIKQRGSKINISADYEYAKFSQYFFTSWHKAENFKVKGTIFITKEAASSISMLKDKTIKKSKQLYTVAIDGIYEKDKLLELYTNDDVFTMLLSITPSGQFVSKIKTKSRIPKPKIEKSDKPPVFIKLTLDLRELSDTSINPIEFFAPESTVSSTSIGNIRIENDFTITELIFPPDKDKLTSSELRLKVRRKGYLTRVLKINGKVISKQYNF